MGNACGTDGVLAGNLGGREPGVAPCPAAWQPPPVHLWQEDAARRTLRVPEDYPSLAAAIKAAAKGDRIEVAEGVYSETLLVDKALEIVGRGAPARVCLLAINASVLTVARSPCRLANLTLRVSAVGDRACACVDAGAGSRVQLEKCVLEGGRCGFQTSGMAVLVATEVRNSAGTGVLCLAGSRLWMLRCSVHSHALSGLHLQGEGVVGYLGQSHIADCKANALTISAGAQGTVEDNVIAANADAGISISDKGSGGDIRDNNISGNGLVGVYIFDAAAATIQNNHLANNGHHNQISVHPSSLPFVICHDNSII